jgi:hypothetical protein
MRKILAVLLASVALIIGFGVGPASASASVSNADGKLTGQVASSADPGYYGQLTAYPTACVVVERKTTAGYWVRTGFSFGQFVLSEFRVCYNDWDSSRDYRVHFNQGYTVDGLRIVSNQGLVTTLCNGNCATKLA